MAVYGYKVYLLNDFSFPLFVNNARVGWPLPTIMIEVDVRALTLLVMYDVYTSMVVSELHMPTA